MPRLILLRILPLVVLAAAILDVAGVFENAPPTPSELSRRLLAGYTESGALGPPVLVDRAVDLGIDFTHDSGARGDYFLMEIMGAGGALADLDGDGDLDVFLGGGGAYDGSEPGQPCRLYRNDGTVFADVTESSGASVRGPVLGVACADYDDDGDVDVYLTRHGANALLRNDTKEGRLAFVEVAAQAGVADEGLGASAAFFDFDRDGRLDLYVANYVRAEVGTGTSCYSTLGLPDYCPPSVHLPAPDRLYRNVGGGRFEDVTESAGVTSLGNGLGVVAADFDGDGWDDLYVANDQTPAFLWRNQGDGTFIDEALPAGCAYDGRGVAIAGMGIAVEDFDFDGDVDLLVTNIRNQPHLLLENEGGVFRDGTGRGGVGSWSTPATGFGVSVFDQDHDGGLDVLVANGRVERGGTDGADAHPYAQRDHFIRLRDGRFVDATDEAGLAAVHVGRGTATGDVDGDGDLDILVTNNAGPAQLLINEPRESGTWLMVDARTGPRGRAAIGARVKVTCGSMTRWRDVRAHQSYLCSSDPRAHFGLGDATRVDEVLVLWPDGRRTVRTGVAVDQVLVITDHDAEPSS